MYELTLPVKLMYEDAKAPYSKYLNEDAGIDLFTAHDYVIAPSETIKLDCGIAINLPLGAFGLIVPRSSWRAKGILCLSVYDAGYQGLIQPFITNCSSKDIEIHKGERVVQFIPLVCPPRKIEVVEEFPVSARGSSGAGSTGRF